MAEPTNLRLGNRLVLSTRVKAWKVKDGGETMVIGLIDPVEGVKIRGGENVQRTILEIERANEPSDVGWKEL